jgi:hypothetical protein
MLAHERDDPRADAGLPSHPIGPSRRWPGPPAYRSGTPMDRGPRMRARPYCLMADELVYARLREELQGRTTSKAFAFLSKPVRRLTSSTVNLFAIISL